MNLDRKMLDRVLKLNDGQLRDLVNQIANQAGIDPNTLGLDTGNLENLRKALGGATQSDLEKLNEIYRDYRNNHRS